MIVPVRSLSKGPPVGCFHRFLTSGCQRETSLSIEVHCRLDAQTDFYGIPLDCVYRVACTATTDRYIRIKGGMKTVKRYLSTYMLLDKTSCPYTVTDSAVAGYTFRWMAEFLPVCSTSAHDEKINMVTPMGLPQRSLRSGLCWYGAMWYSLLVPRELRKILEVRIPEKDAHLWELVKDMITNPARSENARRHLFIVYAIGDDPDQDPLLDGQNGYTQCQRIFSVMGIPHITYLLTNSGYQRLTPVSETQDGEDVVICLRVPNNVVLPPIYMELGEYSCTLQSGLVGNPDCGHQSAFARSGREDRGWWSLYDMDVVTMNVGPTLFHADNDSLMDVLSYLASISKASPTSRYCNMNVNNASETSVLKAAKLGISLKDSDQDGTKHMDWIFVGRRKKVP